MFDVADPASRIHLSKFYRDRLLNNVVPFWFPRCIDGEHQGYLHSLDEDGSLVDTDKSIWAQGRMAWMLATLYSTVESRPEWLVWAESGIQFLKKFGFDADGRMFFHVTREGKPIRKRRYAFSESFASIAFAAVSCSTGDARLGKQAVGLFDHFVDWNFTPGKMPAKFTGKRPMTSIGPRMIAIATAQSLRNDLGDQVDLACFNAQIEEWINQIIALFLKPEHGAVMESVAPDGSIVDTYDGRILNPGHAIEAAWFILDEVAYRKLPATHPWTNAACNMIRFSLSRGWDDEYGGLFYFRDVYDRPVQEYWHDMKFWWPHNEAIIATIMAYQATRDQEFATWHQRLHEWSFRHFDDPEHGEWFGYLHREGSRSSSLKGNLWKSFFHYPRMLWKCSEILGR